MDRSYSTCCGMLVLAVTLMGLLDGAVGIPKGATCNLSWDFDVFLGNRLIDHVTDTKQGLSLLQCVRECLDMPSFDCRSVNYNRQQRECELNKEDERLEPIALSLNSGWNYYQKRITTPDRIAPYNGDHCFVNKCPPGTYEYLDTCVEINLNRPGSFESSRSRCQYKYGDLLQIETEEMYDHLLPLLEGQGTEAKFYIGFKRHLSGELQWLNGVPVNTARFFLNGEPTNMDGIENCGGWEHKLSQYGTNDVPCDMDWSYVCQYDSYVYSLW